MIVANKSFIKRNKNLGFVVLGTALILLIPLVAMQFTDEVKWTAMDFVAMGALLLSIGVLCEVTIRNMKSRRNKIIVGLLFLATLLVIWVELAVGIFD